MSLRFCDQCGAYCSDPWFGLDLLVVAQGMLDLTLPFLAGTYASLLASGFSPALDEKGGWSWRIGEEEVERVSQML
ncbi:unnamed protein product [Prorocentrum cordatum]|uniref:Uncharacterized protein n=1 Tax=Prorocentrum cordatum TaxID=2364126 RepID=A0ABN9TY27_9DINO|nr:unnamed protein product [Polarella glacialis]